MMIKQKKDIIMKEKNTETDKKTEEYLEEWLKEQSTSQDFWKGKKSPKRFRKKEKNNQLIRIEELQELMAKYGDDIDPEKIDFFPAYRKEI